MKPSEFKMRPQQLLTQIGNNSIAVIPAAPEYLRNGDADYRYRQQSDFYYLTGFPEPEAVAVFAPGRKEGEFILFNRERDAAAEIWVGKRAGQDGACSEYGADQSFSIHALDEKVLEILSHYQTIYYPFGCDATFDQRVMGWIKHLRARVRAGVAAPAALKDLSKITSEMRLIKSVAEIEVMRKVASISAAAHCRVMETTKPGMWEYELEATLLYEFTRRGCRSVAYNSIVGAGANACVLHYVDNNTQIKDGDLILVDAGGEYDYYAADITRCFPANGQFSPEQRAIYEVVLAAQLAVIAAIKPGVKWDQLQPIAIRKITEGLIELGILKGQVDDLIESRAYFGFYMHNIGHWLGMDVHDVGQYKIGTEWRSLQPGMVFTVEPGIYIQPQDKVAEKWWNIGVRIEDDVVVTATGCEILTKDVPKRIDEIEALMK